MKQFEHLLRKTIGLDAESIGPTSIQRAVRLRMRSLGLRRPEDYEQLLEKSRTEWNELVESVIVTETWFFRDPALFAAFARHVLEEWLPAHPAAPMRLLSIPCASGEEPYSLVMALLDAGVPPERFQIEAVDISARALARAERGVYGKNSFRGKDLAFRDRYFKPSKEGFVLDPAVRHCVHFSRGNLFSNDFLPGHASYDFIFCRNLLIYFDRPTQRSAIERIERSLAPSGVLFVGPVEQPLVLNHEFVSANIAKGSACRKAGHATRRQRLARLSTRPPIPAWLQPDGASQRHLPASSRLMLPPVSRPSPPFQPDLETARRLADAGRLNEAAEICEAHLRQSRVSAQAYYLLGLVRDAGGDATAIDCYRKALYLEPNHCESLLQMALLLQKNGDLARARAFRSRAQRIKTKV
jgi:chemotaxis protein methyltransferase WspC